MRYIDTSDSYISVFPEVKPRESFQQSFYQNEEISTGESMNLSVEKPAILSTLFRFFYKKS